MHEVEKTRVATIVIPEGRRSLDDAAVERLRESFRKIGLHTPLSIRIVEMMVIDGEETLNVPVLVTGRHRLEAAKREGWDKIDTIEIDGDEIDAELWEISENLHRAELSQLQRSEQIARWIELQDTKRVPLQAATKPQGGRPESGVNAAARELGVEKTDAWRSERIANLSDDAKDAAREVGLDDNRTALLAAAKAAPAEQAKIIRDIAEKRDNDSNRIDRDVKARAAREVAEMLAEHVPGEWWDGLKANLYAAGAANIAHELTNITGEAIMDRRFA